MSDSPTQEEHDKARLILVSIEHVLSDIEVLNSGHDFPDLRHARVKLQSAQRGLEDFLGRKKA